MIQTTQTPGRWDNRKIGITGVNGSLGQALTKELRRQGAKIVGFTHSTIPQTKKLNAEGPQEWIKWQCGQEASLKSSLETLDILIINPKKLK